MLRFAVLRALAVAAIFAAVWLVPLQANATILPVCDGDASSGFPSFASISLADGKLDCASPVPDEDGVDPQIAAMCDMRGATAVAPDRIHPESDARIDAVVSCDGTVHGPLLGPSHGEDGPSSTPLATTQHATLGGTFDLRPALLEELPPYLPMTGAPQAGVDREIFHPPRS
jgi:hypothetical protein